MKKLLGLKTVLLTTPILISSAFANEQPVAQDLVGKFYGAAHLIYLDTDNDRTMPSDPFSSVDHGAGFGGELGYRFNDSTEFRFSHSKINVNKKNSFFDKTYASAIDALYFPTKQNFYVVGGLGYLDIGQEKESLDLGAGYRKYLSKRTAVYLEGKGHYEFSGNYRDTSVRLGFTYFFGDERQSSLAKKEPSVLDKAAAVGASLVAAVSPSVSSSGSDADNDGVLDVNDQCANTPITEKVDENGCTVFNEESDRVALLVHFDNNKAIVKAEYLPEIEKMADVLKSFPQVSLVIEGHTSKVGSSTYNQKISQQRADAVVDVLVNKFNIGNERLTSVGYGEDRLIDLGDTNAAHAANRRIEAKVDLTKKVPVNR